jgi:hypothetical protein
VSACDSLVVSVSTSHAGDPCSKLSISKIFFPMLSFEFQSLVILRYLIQHVDNEIDAPLTRIEWKWKRSMHRANGFETSFVPLFSIWYFQCISTILQIMYDSSLFSSHMQYVMKSYISYNELTCHWYLLFIGQHAPNNSDSNLRVAKWFMPRWVSKQFRVCESAAVLPTVVASVKCITYCWLRVSRRIGAVNMVDRK